MAQVDVKFAVRRATPSDTEMLLARWDEAAQMLAKVDSRYKLAPDAGARWQAALREWLARDDMAVFIAESTIKENHALGYIIGAVATNLPMYLPERYGVVHDLAVDSHGKSSGIGRSLFEALCAWFKAQGVTQVEARVPHRQPVAQAFWRAIHASDLYDVMWLKLD